MLTAPGSPSGRVRSVLAAALVGTFLISGCSGGGTATEAASSGGSDSACATGPVSVGVVNKLDSDPYWGETRKGLEAAAKDLGGSVTITAPSTDTGNAQIPLINNLISKKVGAVVIAGNDPATPAPALKQAKKAGIPVVSYDSDVAADARSLFVNQADLTGVGTSLLKAMRDQIGGSGEIAVMIDNATATNQVQWVNAIKETLASDPSMKDIKLVSTVYGQSSQATSIQQTQALLQAYPALKGIIVPSGLSFPAVAQGLEQAGKLGTIKINGLAPASIMKKYIVAGTAVDIWWNVYDLGYLAYAAAQSVAQCKTTGKAGETLDAGKLGTFTVGENGQVVLGEATLVTAENIDKFPF